MDCLNNFVAYYISLAQLIIISLHLHENSFKHIENYCYVLVLIFCAENKFSYILYDRYYRMFEATQDGLGRNAPVHSIHGSLLAVGELLR